ncbi:alanine racemase [Pararhodobacter marinus]|uniref:alanine racemase n=1 Tax=Pararhodobacter marinus TaxID=2184063 RepID=UPI0035125422
MSAPLLTLDLDALADNWRRLAQLSGSETGATVKADGYGLGASRAARRLAEAGARSFFVALAEEGLAIRKVLGNGPRIFVFSGHMAGDAAMLRELGLIPLINSAEQMARHAETLPDHPFGIQLDSGMNRLGMEAPEWAAVRQIALQTAPQLVMSHLACADEPAHEMNARQRDMFIEMTAGLDAPRSLAATGGMLLGRDYHFELSRPGVGLYGGLPFEGAKPVVHAALPVIQIRDVEPGETVGYGNTWTAARPSRIATVAAGYADGIHRALSHKLQLWAGDTPCPTVGRISMDLIGVDVTDLPDEPEALDLLNAHQTIDNLADVAGTIGYEILTSLGARYKRRYLGGGA